MPRPRLCRKIEFNPDITYFKPQGVPMRELEIVKPTTEEMEAYRLRHINDMEQQEAAKKCAPLKAHINGFFIRRIRKSPTL